MEYFEVPEADPGGDGLCSDNECPCGYPGVTIPRGSGYMYVSRAVVDFRRDARTVVEAKRKIAMMQQGRFVTFGQNVITSTLMCEQGARKRGLDLAVAAADAKYWWETGLVPLRATPLAGSSEARRERERLGLDKIIDVEASSLEEARKQIRLQLPEGFQVLEERIISDGEPQIARAFGDTTEAAFDEAQRSAPKGTEILEKKVISAAEQRTITISVEATCERSAEAMSVQKAKENSRNRMTTSSIKLITAGEKGFLGIGRKPNQYKVELLEHLPATVEITHRPRARIVARTGQQ